MSMWVPPTVSRELLDERQRRETQALQGLVEERGWQWVEDFNRELHNIWPGMKLLWCPDPAPVDAVAMGAQPGRWCILMPSQTGGPGFVKPLLAADGESYIEPGSWVFDMLKSQDWWNPEVRRERARVQRQLEEAKLKREEEERREFDADVYERWLAGNSTRISMGGKYSQSVKGLRSAKGSRGVKGGSSSRKN